METIFLIGILIFSLSSLYFAFMHRKSFNTAALVSLITIASYIVMLEGSFASISADGETVLYTRWLFYALSCSLLMYEIGRSLKFTAQEIATVVYLINIVMITGALSAVFTGGYMLALFAVSTAAYAALVYRILKAKSKNLSFVLRYVLLGWTAFPVVFILAPEGYGLVSATVSVGAYLVLDIFTKIVFYIDGYSTKTLKS